MGNTVPGFALRVDRCRRTGRPVVFMVGAAVIELRPFDINHWPLGGDERRVMVIMSSQHDGSPLDWYYLTDRCRVVDWDNGRIVGAGRLERFRKGERFPGVPHLPVAKLIGYRFVPEFNWRSIGVIGV